MDNENYILYIGVLSVMFVISLYFLYWYKDRKMDRKERSLAEGVAKPSPEILKLQLQAYERLVLLIERIALPNLITRIPPGELNMRQYQSALIEQIKAEYEHNTTQQIYVSPAGWQAVQKLKEQNIFIIGKVAETLAPDATGNELAQRIAALLNADDNVSMHPMVLDALNYEAKRLL
jgi:hypothetical protein